MTKHYTNLKEGANRRYSEENVQAWIQADENLGLTKSVFRTYNGTNTQLGHNVTA